MTIHYRLGRYATRIAFYRPRLGTSTLFRNCSHRIHAMATITLTHVSMYLHSLSNTRFEAIRKTWRENGLSCRLRAKVLPHNTMKLADIKADIKGLVRSCSMQKIMPSFFLAGYLATNEMIFSFCQRRPPSRRCGRHTTMQHRSLRT